MLILRQLSKTYLGSGVGLQPVDLSIETGERLVLLGPSGSGKSTLLRLIVGLEKPTSGEVWRNGIRIDRLPPHQRGVALLPQRPALYPHLTIQANLQTVSPPPDTEILTETVEILRLSGLLARYPHQLSGGEKQRVALAKLLLRRCPVWLLDEPFAALDPPFRAEFRQDLHLLSARANATIIIVSHDPIDASALGRRLGVLGDGLLQQLGTPEQLRTRPGNRFVAFALGQFCFVDGRSAAPGRFVSDCETVQLRLPSRIADSRVGRRFALGLQPDDLLPDPNGTTGWDVISTEPAGSGWLLTIANGRFRLQAAWPERQPPALGSPWPWGIRPDRGVWFDGETGVRLE